LTCSNCDWATNSILAAFYQEGRIVNNSHFVDVHYQLIAILEKGIRVVGASLCALSSQWSTHLLEAASLLVTT